MHTHIACAWALEPRCHISMWRDQHWLVHGSGGRMVWGVGGPPAPTRRVWRVRVFLRGSARTHDIIDADEPHGGMNGASDYFLPIRR